MLYSAHSNALGFYSLLLTHYLQVNNHFCGGNGNVLVAQVATDAPSSKSTIELQLLFVSDTLDAPAAAAPVAFQDRCRDLYQEAGGGAPRRLLDTALLHGLNGAELDRYQRSAAAAVQKFDSFAALAAAEGGRKLRAAFRLSCSMQALPLHNLVTSNNWMEFFFKPASGNRTVVLEVA